MTRCFQLFLNHTFSFNQRPHPHSANDQTNFRLSNDQATAKLWLFYLYYMLSTTIFLHWISFKWLLLYVLSIHTKDSLLCYTKMSHILIRHLILFPFLSLSKLLLFASVYLMYFQSFLLAFLCLNFLNQI